MKSGKEAVSMATYDSSNEVRCNLAVDFVRGRKFDGPLKIKISVSNNRVKASNKLSIVVYDSNCFSCTEDGACKTVKVKYQFFPVSFFDS